MNDFGWMWIFIILMILIFLVTEFQIGSFLGGLCVAFIIKYLSQYMNDERIKVLEK